MQGKSLRDLGLLLFRVLGGIFVESIRIDGGRFALFVTPLVIIPLREAAELRQTAAFGALFLGQRLVPDLQVQSGDGSLIQSGDGSLIDC